MDYWRASLILGLTVLAVSECIGQKKEPMSPSLEARLKGFFADKEAQARALAKTENQEQSPDVWKFFAAGKEGDWKGVATIYRVLRSGAYQYEGGNKDKLLVTMAWQPLNEAFGAYEGFTDCAEDYLRMFGQEILDSIPRDSIYFGGTDPGRWIVTAFCKSHPKGDPCFVLTQNALADGLYLKYLRAMYGDRITMPSEEDSQKAFSNYVADAKKRLDAGQLKPGERVTVDNEGKVQVSGQVAVMQINARLARAIFDANPDQEFFIEESFSLDWMYPHLSPNGLIMKINRKPLAEISIETIQKDRDYWTRLVDRALGQWLTPQTPVKDVCDFATEVFLSKDYGKFQADPRFVRNAYACKTFSKLRSSLAGVYTWRWKETKSAAEKARMAKEADFAFKQAFALCPYSPEAVFRYVNLLKDQARKDDALSIAETAASLDPRNKQFADLVRTLEQE